MNILHCSYDHRGNPWVGGGGAWRAVELYRVLRERGHRIRMMCGRYPGGQAMADDPFEVEFAGSETGSYLKSTLGYTLAARRRVRRIRNEFDVVIEDYSPWNPLYLNPTAGTPMALQIQFCLGWNYFKRYGPLGLPLAWIERHYPRRFPEVAVINRSICDHIGRDATVISNGIDAGLLEQAPLPGEYIGFMGRIDAWVKGVDTLVDAARRIDLPVRLAGDGRDRKRLQEASASLKQVQWVGHLNKEQRIDFIRRSKFMVSPSRSEGQNMVVLESAALGKPVIVSDIAGLRYAVEAGFGLAFPVESPDALASLMKQLWNEPSTLERLADRARPYMESRTWPKLAVEFESFCSRAAGKSDNTGERGSSAA